MVFPACRLGWVARESRLTMASLCDPLAVKRQLRREARQRRDQQGDREQLSQTIWERFLALPEFAAAETVMLYVDMRSEVRTRPFLPVVMAAGKRVAVPYCQDEELALFHLQDLDQLAPGCFGVLEPRVELRGVPSYRVEPVELDVVMVPGVAFDRRGGRLGYGKGYYDRLLRRLRPDALAVGVAFECQIVPEIPMHHHDVFMDKVVTETALYEGRGR